VAYIGNDPSISFGYVVSANGVPAVPVMKRGVPYEWPYPNDAELWQAMHTRGVDDPQAHPNVRPWERLFKVKDIYVTGGSKAEVIRRLLEARVNPVGCSPEEIEHANEKAKMVVTPDSIRPPNKGEKPSVELSPRVKRGGD